MIMLLGIGLTMLLASMKAPPRRKGNRAQQMNTAAAVAEPQ